MEAVVLLVALILRFIIAYAIGYFAAELDHDPFFWGAASFLLLGLWAVVFLMAWHWLTLVD